MCDALHSIEDWVRYGDEIRRPLLVGENLTKSEKICIVGAGLSGLTIAYRIASKRPDIEIEILEKTDRCGGTIETWRDGEWLCDVAVNAARPHPAFWRLIDDLKLNEQFSPSRSEATTRWIYQNNKKKRLSFFTALSMGPFRLFHSIKTSRNGGASVAGLIPEQSIADAMTLGIVNDLSTNVDADFLMPSITRYGENPPIKWSKLKKQIQKTYPIFTPRKGSLASLRGGMDTLIQALVERLNEIRNVKFHFLQSFDNPVHAAVERNVPIESVIWCGPLTRTPDQYTNLGIYVAGYTKTDTRDVPIGYGTLIPDPKVPISGILHESDVHQSPRAPENHRLFRIMVPSDRDADDTSVRKSLKKILSSSEPVLFKKIADRMIPSYKPGYMASLEAKGIEYSRAGWFYSGISVTHVVTEAERIADLF